MPSKKYHLNFILLTVFLIAVKMIIGDELSSAMPVDLSKCKLTQLGTEYRGSISTTAGGIRCQFWDSDHPHHQISPNIKDADFPEKSMSLAKNYCRNPTRESRGPWCYTSEATLIDDECAVPLCNYGGTPRRVYFPLRLSMLIITLDSDLKSLPLECRISGIGAEYAGKRKVSSSGRKCKSWDKRYKLENGKTSKFPSTAFPDSSRHKAGRFCRNPDDSTGGPWCYVEEEDFETVEKDYCDIPFCDDKDCSSYLRNASVYSTLTGLNSTYGNITFWIKLWNPNDERYAEARILLSLLPIPTSAQQIAQDWRAGVELVISNTGTRKAYPIIDEEEDSESTPEILVGTNWTGIWLTWGGGFISLGKYGVTKPLITEEYKRKSTISSLYPESFLYYGLMGTGVLWSTEFCQETCEVHTTFGLEFLRVWPLQRNNDTYEIHFYVRANQSAAVQIYRTPGAPFPFFMITIGDNDVTSLTYQESEKAIKQYLKEVPTKGLLNFWAWKEFSISIFGSHLRLFAQQSYGNDEMLYVNLNAFNSLRWFSIGSKDSIAYWTLFCPPEEKDKVEDPWPPNCITDLTDFNYKGEQWISTGEIPCIPWIAKEVPDDLKRDNYFVDGSVLKALNKCRNPNNDPKGPYCYAMSSQQTTDISKEYCPIRSCRSSECRMAGTANDYIGTLSTTRSGRTCEKWFSDYELEEVQIVTTTTTVATTVSRRTPRPTRVKPRKQRPMTKQDIMLSIDLPMETPERKKPAPPGFTAVKPVHQVDRTYFNDSLYPERSVRNASNYCRDPSRNIAGTWCYTTDPLVPHDLCNVRDCEKPEECIFFVRGVGIGRRLYVLPEHRSEGLSFSLKAWEPDQPDSITFVFTADDGFKSRYILKIGASDNENVLLYYESEQQAISLVKKKVLPHLLYLGKWSSFVIRIPRGRVSLYYEGAPDPLFDWEHPKPTEAFLPVYYYYNSEKGHTIGVAFDCASRCHIEITETERHTRILPLSVWNKKETPSPDKLQLMIRAKGVVLVPLLLLPAVPGFYALTLGESGQWIHFIKNTYPNVQIFHKQKSPNPIFTTNSWTNITITWTEKAIDVFCNDTLVFHYEHHSPLLFYFFSLAVDPGGWATWAANCIPSDIDGAPLDGGWSEWGPWACSASCDGGIGTRKRMCNSPEPNVRGEPCLGPSVMTGRCNTVVCGDILDDTITLIRRRIRRNNTALSVKEGASITITSDRDLIKLISTESPESEMQWSHNGIFLPDVNGRIEIKDNDVAIRSATLNDSGVYTMTVRRVDGSHMIFKVVSLAVVPIKESVRIHESLAMSVTCHCVILGYVYSDLRVYWTIKDRVWKDYGIALPLAINVDAVPAVNKSHEGTWKCIVEQNDLDFRWTTNMILVKDPPNWRSYLMEDALTRPIFGWMPNEKFVAVSAVVIFLILTVCIISGSVALIRFRKSLRVSVTPRKKEAADDILSRYKRSRKYETREVKDVADAVEVVREESSPDEESGKMKEPLRHVRRAPTERATQTIPGEKKIIKMLKMKMSKESTKVDDDSKKPESVEEEDEEQVEKRVRRPSKKIVVSEDEEEDEIKKFRFEACGTRWCPIKSKRLTPPEKREKEEVHLLEDTDVEE